MKETHFISTVFLCIDLMNETDDRITENCRNGLELIKTTNPNSTKHPHALNVKRHGSCYKGLNIGILVSHIIPKFCNQGRLKIFGPLAFKIDCSTILTFMGVDRLYTVCVPLWCFRISSIVSRGNSG